MSQSWRTSIRAEYHFAPCFFWCGTNRSLLEKWTPKTYYTPDQRCHLVVYFNKYFFTVGCLHSLGVS